MTPRQVRAWREARGWSQAQAAEWYGVSERTWRRYEAEDVQVPRPLALRLTGGNEVPLTSRPLQR